MSHSSLWLRRLRVMRSGQAVYDQEFHLGVNIIRGENGVGKSTIADFIFYILGGEFDNWKGYAKLCDEIQAEIVTRGGVITLRRARGTKLTPIQLYFGPVAKAEREALDNWSLVPIRRTDSRESFSQVMMRACGIPEAQNVAGGNVTLHQIMRLLYSDQRTPAPRLFRLEPFDTRDIREAVGGLLIGLNVYEAYSIQVELKQLDNQFKEKSQELSLKIASVPASFGSITVPAIRQQLKVILDERQKIESEITNVDELVDGAEASGFMKERAAALRKIRSLRSKIVAAEEKIEGLELDLSDLDAYLDYLRDTSIKLPAAERTSQIIGNIEFTHCPACLTPLSSAADKAACIVCGSDRSPEEEQSRYLRIKLDIDIQIRESNQLVEDKSVSKGKAELELRDLQKEHQQLLDDFAVRFDLSSSPRESFLATRNARLGQLSGETTTYSRFLQVARDIEILSEEKANIQRSMDLLKSRQEALTRLSLNRTQVAMTAISNIAVGLLASDLPRQREFREANNVAVQFGDDVVLVDGEANFAESSNVILKNTAILALFSAATLDEKFFSSPLPVNGQCRRQGDGR